MDLAALCVCGGKNDTNGIYLAVLVKIWPLLTTLWLPSHPTLPTYESSCVFTMQVIIYLKWQEIQLAIHCTVDTVNHFE